MNPRSILKTVCSLIVYLLQIVASSKAGTHFASHVSVNTPSRSFFHGVGDPLPVLPQHGKQFLRPRNRNHRRPGNSQTDHFGYPKVKPTIPFTKEDVFHDNSIKVTPLQHNNYFDVAIPLLPPSPYKVDSPDPESLWPEGLFLPPISAPRFGSRRVDNNRFPDPYLVEGSEAVAAIRRADYHGHFYFHDIPHIESLLANQDLRKQNNLKPHRIGSIRHNWPNHRP